MASRLRKNEIEDQLQDSSDSDSDEGVSHRLQGNSSDSDSDEEVGLPKKQSSSKLNGRKLSTTNQERLQSRKRKAESIEEAIPAKLSRNTPSKNNVENVSISPRERSSPRNAKRQVSGVPNKFVLSNCYVKLSAKKNLFTSDMEEKTASVSSSKSETNDVYAGKHQDQTSSDESETIFKTSTKKKKRDSKMYGKLMESCPEVYSVKSPSKSSPLKVRLYRDSPKTKNRVSSSAKKYDVASPVCEKISSKPCSPKVGKDESGSDSDPITLKKSPFVSGSYKTWRSPLRTQNRMKTPKKKYVEDCVNEYISQNNISSPAKDQSPSRKSRFANEIYKTWRSPPRTQNHTTSPKKSYVEDSVNEDIKNNISSLFKNNITSSEDSKQSEIHQTIDRSNKPMGELKRLNIDMKESVMSPRSQNRMTTPKKNYFEDSVNEDICQNIISSPAESNTTLSQDCENSENKPTIDKSTKELMRLNIDMKETAISPRRQKRVRTPNERFVEDSLIRPFTSSEKNANQSKSSSKCKAKNEDLLSDDETVVSDLVKVEFDILKDDRNKQVLTPRKGRRSSVTFSPLPPKHRTPKKTYSDFSEEESPQKKSSIRNLNRRSLKDIKENMPENVECVTPIKQNERASKILCSSALKDDGDYNDQDQCSTPLQRKSLTVTTPVSKKSTGRGFLTPSMARKESSSHSRTEDELDATRRQLHISTVPKSLPCRDNEFSQIKSFLTRKIEHLSGGCMYISGVPGTGKTATVHAVIRSLQENVDNGDLTEFDFVEVNGLRLTEPKQAYVRIYQALSDKKLTPDQAQQLLSRKFSGNCKKSTIILVDELDYLCNRRQDVVYNILDWPTKRGSALVVLTISNTMDLAERTLKGRVTSRMGLTRVTFQPYSHHQLQEIVLDRLCGSAAFHPDAVQLVARKVAAVSGDARRALDICRRTTELVSSGEQVTAGHVQKALMQIFSGPRVLVIQQLSGLSQLVLRSLRDVSHATGIEESTVAQLYKHLEQISVLENLPLPTVGAVLQNCVSLVNLGLIVAEKARNDINRKLSLNVSSDDIHYALDNVRSL